MSKFNDEICKKAVEKFGIKNLASEKKMFYVSKKIAAIIFLVFIGAGISGEVVIAKKVNCSSFLTQQKAQALFETDKVKYKALDKDNNGVACESLP